MKSALDVESRKTAHSLLKQFRILRKFEKKQNLRGVYYTLNRGLKLLQKFKLKYKNDALLSTLVNIAKEQTVLLSSLKDIVTRDDKIDFFKNLEKFFNSVADQLRQIMANGGVKIASKKPKN